MTKRLMAIFAHPDDEGAMGGTLAHYARHDTEITLICATRGEVGEISDPSLATQETLGEVREGELRKAADILGIDRLAFLDRKDSGMQGTPPNEDPEALIQADPDEVIGQLVGLMRQYKPDVVVTFEPFGWYGHPDHQIMSKWSTDAFAKVGDPEAFPEQGAAWQPKRLFYSVIPFSKFGGMMEEAIEKGYFEEEGFGVDIPEEEQLKTETAVTHIIDVSDYYDIRETSRMCHQTQFGEESFFRKIPRELMEPVSSHEHFIQVYPQPAAKLRENRQSNLFAE